MKIYINPKHLQSLKETPLFVQYASGRGRQAGYIFGIKIMNDPSIEEWEIR